MGRTKANSKALFKCMVKNKTDTSADLYFYGDIISENSEFRWNKDDKCPSDVVKILDECKDAETLNIYINSNGGDVFAGIAIFNRLRAHKAHKVVHVDGLAASIASVIALAGDEIIMPSNSYMMIHKAWTIVIGNSDDLRDAADRLETIEESIVGVYDECSGEDFDTEKIKDLMAAETWLTAEDAAEMFEGVTVEGSIKAAACISGIARMSAPDGVIVTPEDEQTNPDPNNPPAPNSEDGGAEPEDDTEKEAIENRLKILDSFIFTEGECENE